MKKHLYFLFIATFFFFSCKKEDNNDNNLAPDTTPIVFVHGLLASGDTWGNMVMRYTSNNFPADRLYAFDYNSLNFLAGGSLDTVGLDNFIEEVLQKTSSTQVNLVGHSLGGTTSYAYLSNPAHALKVAHYAHVASGPKTSAAGPNADVPTLNIYSTNDLVTPSTDIPGADNLMLTGKDHYEVATCKETFDAIYRFFNDDKAPSTLEITSQSEVQIGGKVVSLGENNAKVNASVSVFEVNPLNGERMSTLPDFTLSINSKGEWGPHLVPSTKRFEFEVNPNDPNDRIVHYYFEPFKHDNPLVYLRTLPPSNSIGGLLVSAIPKNDSLAVAVIFMSNQGVIYTRDSLTVEGYDLSTQDFCSWEDNTIAFFLYDDGDHQTEILIPPYDDIFGENAFLERADMFFQTQTPQSIHCRFNGTDLYARNWKSNTEGVSIVVFN